MSEEIRQNELDTIDLYIHDNDTILDIGACQGNWSVDVLIRKQNVAIHLFEPMPPNFSILLENIQPFTSNNALYCNNCAMSNVLSTEKPFFYSPNREGGGSFVPRYYVESNYTRFNVVSTTIDNYCKKHDIHKIDFIKLDVEGHEQFVLEGGDFILQNNMITHIQFEYGGSTFLDQQATFLSIFDQLTSYNYKIGYIEDKQFVQLTRNDIEQLENEERKNYPQILQRNFLPNKYNKINYFASLTP